MAFRQPTYHAPPRIYTERAGTQSPPQQSAQDGAAQETQDWVLFSPAAPSFTDGTHTTSTGRTRTAGHSRVSDFGSLDTAARSYGVYDEEEGQMEEGEEDGELDSLDSHLHEFRTEPSVYRQDDDGDGEGPVLPKHDGLGSFRVDGAMGEDVQQHLYAFEIYNPRRVKRRRESLEIGEMALENERVAEMERTRRIEKWRMEQSRALVDEIQRETRRRKQSMSTDKRSVVADREQEDVATFDAVEETPRPVGESDSLWNRLTKRVIRDLMGIDDDLLSIIFGETLPADDDLSTTLPIPTSTTASPDKSSWEYRLLERIARELGLLVNQLSDHPGAFNTYIQTQQTALPYAGLPVIPESARDIPQPEPEPLTSTLEFHPTITKPVPIPASIEDEDTTPRQSPTITREEWEQDLDIKMVFRYLRSRFTSSQPPAQAQTQVPAAQVPLTKANLAGAGSRDSLARVRAHHPLVKQRERRRSFKACAESVGRGAAGGWRDGAGTATGSSRHYWDIGNSVGSVGSGSVSLVVGGMGSWGEV
ncbi:hypothetical protein CJF30_00004547 [Rutstroemia sp. NJR-2017a BBW]|nr:hypothetical protein CJF30_00004547 [Rutstroemia sp. NJR-2017a BBW]